MNRPESRPFKEQLLTLRSHMRKNLTRMSPATTGRTYGYEKGNCAASDGQSKASEIQREEGAFLGLLGIDNRMLNRIERALERIENREFGRCQNCGASIKKTRLRALPYAELCIKCAKSIEMN